MTLPTFADYEAPLLAALRGAIARGEALENGARRPGQPDGLLGRHLNDAARLIAAIELASSQRRLHYFDLTDEEAARFEGLKTLYGQVHDYARTMLLDRRDPDVRVSAPRLARALEKKVAIDAYAWPE